MSDGDYVIIVTRLLLALLAGGVIGLERTYHGRPAGFRTHALVCTASSLLMLLMVLQFESFSGMRIEHVNVQMDPTRIAQGIMTGIGFLGAGVIIKERLTIRGLTTAGSIWMTASIGIIIGMGYYFAAGVATAITLGTLSIFRWIERVLPSMRYSKLTVRFHRKDYLPESELRGLLKEHGIRSGRSSYILNSDGKMFEYQMTVYTRDLQHFRQLAETLDGMERVHEFTLTSIGE